MTTTPGGDGGSSSVRTTRRVPSRARRPGGGAVVSTPRRCPSPGTCESTPSSTASSSPPSSVVIPVRRTIEALPPRSTSVVGRGAGARALTNGGRASPRGGLLRRSRRRGQSSCPLLRLPRGTTPPSRRLPPRPTSAGRGARVSNGENPGDPRRPQRPLRPPLRRSRRRASPRLPLRRISRRGQSSWPLRLPRGTSPSQDGPRRLPVGPARRTGRRVGSRPTTTTTTTPRGGGRPTIRPIIKDAVPPSIRWRGGRRRRRPSR